MLVSRDPDQLVDAIVVIDGPLGPDGPPKNDRAIDRQCAAGILRGRCQPTPISHPSSKPFIAATYQLVPALGQNTSVWIQGEPPQTGITFIQTNPTVALAAMIPRGVLSGFLRGYDRFHSAAFSSRRSPTGIGEPVRVTWLRVRSRPGILATRSAT